MSAINKVFIKLKEEGYGALIGYVMAGDPEPKYTPKIAEALIKGGIDILELGVPFSDPIADGPTIQAASTQALREGTTPKIVLEIAELIKRKHDAPIALMTYFNPVFRMGLEKFFTSAKNYLIDATIIPDLPLEESQDYRAAASAHGIDTIFLAAPSTSNERLKKIVDCSSGFLYLVSRFGVTGAKASMEDSTLNLVKRVLPFTSGRISLAVGFGVSKPEHVKRIIGVGADGVIVGSLFVDIIKKNRNNPDNMLIELESAARKLKDATRR